MEDLSKEKKISAYLEKELSSKEAAAFEREIAQDEDLAREVSFFSHLADAVQAEHDDDLLKKKLEAANARWHQRQQEKTKVIPLRRIATIAATVAVLAVAGYFIYQEVEENPEEVFAAYYEPLDDEILEIETGTRNIIENPERKEWLKEAQQLYSAGDYIAAQEVFEQVLEEYPDDKTAQLYLGVTYLELEDVQLAQEQLEEIINEDLYNLELPEQQYAWSAANWYYGLVLLKLDNIEAARAVFEKLTDNTQSTYQEQAATILKTL